MRSIMFVGSNCGEEARGVRVFEVDAASGAFEQIACVEEAVDPIYLALSADGRFLYSAQKFSRDSELPGAVAAYALENGFRPVMICEQAVALTVPCHISLSPDGKRLYYAEYRNAWAGAMDINPDGTLCAPAAKVHHTGRGPNSVRQEAAHCHYALCPDGKNLCVCDLGIDRVVVYGASCSGEMQPLSGKGYSGEPGAGPRHLAFHPDGRRAYLLNELQSSVVSFDYSDGVFTKTGVYSMLPDGFSGETKAAAIKISPDGRFLLASNRGHDSIAVFSIIPDTGQLRRVNIAPLGGRFPRDFSFAAGSGGRLVMVGHKLSDEAAMYRFEESDGSLVQTGDVFHMTKPLCFVPALV